ncbi:suppressor of fused domain protein [Microlunatus antarcticus]|uniref:Suppressor of fused-like domain-containing protein n=1 Tax=Microlunatus antarcticus TaxID=53388 RepID=A0A7W5JVU2_9ACTN|nr:hypothetical protein [Microlunatus antarcticus]
MPHYDVASWNHALERHVASYFGTHSISQERWPLGPVERRIPGFFVYKVGPGPRFSGWTFLTAGCWGATAEAGHGLEFVLSTNADDLRHVEVLTMLAYYHAGPPDQRLDLGHTVPIGEAWTPGSACEYELIGLPYAYGPDLEVCAWLNGHIQVLAVQPITTAEREFKVEHGAEALEDRLEEAAVEFANPMRRSAV